MNKGAPGLPRAGRPRPPPPLPGFESINRYWDPSHEYFAAKLLPGEYYVTRNEELLTTVLGSCIAACIRDPLAGVGGMNHFMLPEDANGSGHWHAYDAAASTRYGNFAMEHLINDVIKYGGRRERMEVKIFGGGRIIASMTNIGERNVDFVYEYLQYEGMRVVAADTGDVYPRKVIYYPMTGRARVKKLYSQHNSTIVDRENSYRRSLEKQPVAGEIELF